MRWAADIAGLTLSIMAAIARTLTLDVIGLFVTPFINAETNPVWGNREDPLPPHWYRRGQPRWWRYYAWHALRNRSANARYLFTEPPQSEWDVRGWWHPEQAVRERRAWDAWRLVRVGWRTEVWRVWRTKSGRIAEIRLGWKYSGVPGFFVTHQFRVGG